MAAGLGTQSAIPRKSVENKRRVMVEACDFVFTAWRMARTGQDDRQKPDFSENKSPFPIVSALARHLPEG
jgi:hypothetical protein